jgi:hypothetical protein
VTRAGGLNRFDEPNFRIVWGASRLSWIGGRWLDRDASGNVVRETVELRKVPKYLPLERWHVERWLPPEAYGSPDEWYRRTAEMQDGFSIPALGPFPSRGEYEHCFTLERGGGFLPLDATVCDWVVRAIEWARRQPAQSARAALMQRETRKERNWHRAADDLFDDCALPFDGHAFVAAG